MKHCLHLLAVFSFLGSSGTEFNRFDLDFVQFMHREHCLYPLHNVSSLHHPAPQPAVSGHQSPVAIRVPYPPAPEWNDGTCCKKCSLDIEICTLSGTCCPDLFDHLPSVEESASRIKIVCQYLALKNSENEFRFLSAWMFIKCADYYSGDPEIKDKCENPGKWTGWDTIIPVSRNRNDSVHYQNIYCALCNGVSKTDVLPWNVSLQCDGSARILPSSSETVIDEVKSTPGCNIAYQSSSLETCKPPEISECNVTGDWRAYDPVTEAACHAYTARYKGKYKNIFCFLCNAAEPYDLPSRCRDMGPGPVWPSFSALLKFTAPQVLEEQDNVRCKHTQIFDELEDICRDLYCLPPKILSNGECVDAVYHLTGVAFEAFLRLVLNNTVTVPNVHDTAEDAWSLYEEYMNDLGVSDIVFERSIYYETTLDNDSLVEGFVLHFKLYFPFNSDLSNIFVNQLLSLGPNGRVFVSGERQLFNMVLGYYESIKHEASRPGTVLKASDTSKPLILIDNILPPLLKNKRQPIFEAKLTLITKVLGCPLIKLEATNDELRANGSLRDVKKAYPPGSFTALNQSGNISAYVCADDFLVSAGRTYSKRDITTYPSDTDLLPQGILSLVCTCISVICLVITLTVYSLFQELRSQPGINNMALATCLLIAQTLFQFGSDQADSLPPWGCQTVGILIHFFWLMVIFWMNVCSVHMFFVFKKLNKVSTCRRTLKNTILYTTYTVCSSVLIVIVNIVVTIMHPDLVGIGYGGSMCYITDYHMVGYVFALPVGIIVVVNLCSFSAVIVQMWRAPTVNSETKHTRNFFTIYAKLSTITGITWLFGFLFFATKIEVLEYIFILLNASQGVFLLLAFVCNKRVLGLFRKRMEQIKFSFPKFHTMKTFASTGTVNKSSNQ